MKAWRMGIVFLMMILLLAGAAMAEEAISEYLILASTEQPLAADYEPADLVKLASRQKDPEATLSVYTASTTSIQLCKVAAEALVNMCNAAEHQGVTLYVRQGYRSYESEETYYARMEKRGEKAHKPGECDYQTGLAVTIVGKEWRNKTLTEEFAQSAESQWLEANAYKYGFVYRYPQGLEATTGWAWEPWHLRYVGDPAEQMMVKKLCLEDFVLGGVEIKPVVHPEFIPGQMKVMEDVGPDGDHELSLFQNVDELE